MDYSKPIFLSKNKHSKSFLDLGKAIPHRVTRYLHVKGTRRQTVKMFEHAKDVEVEIRKIIPYNSSLKNEAYSRCQLDVVDSLGFREEGSWMGLVEILQINYFLGIFVPKFSLSIPLFVQRSFPPTPFFRR